MIMGWRRRRSGYQGRNSNSFKGRVEDKLRTRIERQMFSRAYQLNPLKLKPLHIYEACHTREELDSFATLEYRYKRSLETIKTLLIDLEHPYRFGISAFGNRYTAMGISITLPRELPGISSYECKDSPYKLSTLPEDMMKELLRWAKVWVALDIQSTMVSERIGELFVHCNTMGQVLRVWPGIAGFLPDEGKDKLAGKKVKSPYPEGLIHREHDSEGNTISRRLDERWTPEALKPYELLISEALVMAEVPRNISSHDHTVEYVAV